MNSCLSVTAPTLPPFPLGGKPLFGIGKFTYERKDYDRPLSILASAMCDVWRVNFMPLRLAQLLNHLLLPGAARKTGTRKPDTHTTPACGRFCAGTRQILTARSYLHFPASNAQFHLPGQFPRKSSQRYLLIPQSAPGLSYAWLLNLDSVPGKSHTCAQITFPSHLLAFGISQSTAKVANSEFFLFPPHWPDCFVADRTKLTPFGSFLVASMDTYRLAISANLPRKHFPTNGRYTHCGTGSPPSATRPLTTCSQYDRRSATPACKPPPATPHQTQQALSQSPTQHSSLLPRKGIIRR